MDRDDDNLPAKPLVIGISSRALLDLEQEDKIFKIQGTQAFIDYQREHRNELIPKGLPSTAIRRFFLTREIVLFNVVGWWSLRGSRSRIWKLP